MLFIITFTTLNLNHVFFPIGISIKRVGDYTYVEGGSLGVMAKFDGGMTFHLSILGELRGKIVGICGRFDDDPSSKSKTLIE